MCPPSRWAEFFADLHKLFPDGLAPGAQISRKPSLSGGSRLPIYQVGAFEASYQRKASSTSAGVTTSTAAWRQSLCSGLLGGTRLQSANCLGPAWGYS